jgi:hypothetical protein
MRFLCPECLDGVNHSPVKTEQMVGGGVSWWYATVNGKILGAAHQDDKPAMENLRDIQAKYPLISCEDKGVKMLACQNTMCREKDLFKNQSYFVVPDEIQEKLRQGVPVINKWRTWSQDKGVTAGMLRVSGVLGKEGVIVTSPIVDVKKHGNFWVVTTDGGEYAYNQSGTNVGIKKCDEPMLFIMGSEYNPTLSKELSLNILSVAIDKQNKHNNKIN